MGRLLLGDFPNHTDAGAPAELCRAVTSPLLQVPMEYNHLQELPVVALRNRLLLLHHLSELFCPCIPMFDLEGALGETGLGPAVGFDTLRGILISQGKVPAPAGGPGLHELSPQNGWERVLGHSLLSQRSRHAMPAPHCAFGALRVDRQRLLTTSGSHPCRV